MKELSELIGKTLTKIENLELGTSNVTLYTDSGEKLIIWHETVASLYNRVNVITGDISDIIGSPITIATIKTISENQLYLYAIATDKGLVYISWPGSPRLFVTKYLKGE